MSIQSEYILTSKKEAGRLCTKKIENRNAASKQAKRENPTLQV